MDDRFARQRMITEIGEAGQQRLRSARAVVVGAGGLGSPVITYLACAGVGKIRIIDPDKVEITNLNRQFVHGAADIGRKKALSAGEFIASITDDVEVEVSSRRLDKTNARELLAGADVIVDCVDSIATRLVVCEAALALDIPLIEGGVDGFYGFVTAVRRGSACPGCIGYGEADEKKAAALGAAAGVIGSLEALEAIKLLLGLEDVCFEKMIQFDGLRGELETIEIIRNKSCPVCGEYGNE